VQPAQQLPAPQPVSQPQQPPTSQLPQPVTQPQPPEIEGLSEIEQFVSGRLPSTVSTSIRQFGYDLFKQPPSTFAPVEKVPVGPEYVIGPGDEIRVTVWGKIDGQWTLVVDRDGNIMIPRIGALGVAGLTFKELKDLLYREFSKHYKGFEMNVSMGALRTIRVYVVGYAQRPGAYTVSSLSTLVNALFEAGGPSKTGSMRRIEVKRNGKKIVEFDMYDLILKGDKTKDIRLMPEDVIFIPPTGPLVGIGGSVKSPAIYELKGETRIEDLFSMAGGLTASAYLQRIQVERIFQNEVKIILDTDLKGLDKEKDILLKDGDIVKVFPIINVVINAVTLKGNVTKPGQYQWFEGMRVSDVVKDPTKDLLPETYFEHALIERYIPPDYHREVISLNLGKALFNKDGNEDKLLQPYDTLTIYSKWDFLEKPKVRVSGAVNKPGEFEFKPNMKVSDLLKLAGGTKYFASIDKAELTRVTPTPEGPKTERININLEKALADVPNHNIYLQQDDYLFVRTVPEWQLYRKVSITGAVRFPGIYTIKKGERLSSLLERAGGFTDMAYIRGAIFTRLSVKELQQKNIDEMIDRLERELTGVGTAQVATATTSEEAKIFQMELEQKRQFISRLRTIKAQGRMVIKLDTPERLRNTTYDIELEEGDSLHIPERPATLQVLGAVYNQTAFIYDRFKSLSDYINLAGGYTRNADKSYTYILKVDGSAVRPQKGFLGISWSWSTRRWEFEEVELEEGDTIVVPERLERIAWMRNIKDITQILYQIAVTAGVLITVF
jgi:protein involved in polysaccharide export with SLBB domain